MLKILKHFILFLIALLLFSVAVANNNNDINKSKDCTVYVVQRAWHTGLIFYIEDICDNIFPEIKTYNDYKYIDVGWGDKKFFMSDGRPFFIGARAVLWPTQGVIQLYPFTISPERSYGPNARIKEIKVTKSQLDKLTSFVSNSLKRDNNNTIIAADEESVQSRFFLSKPRYHLFNNCNTYMAKAFKKAGFDIRSFFVLNANQLFRQLEKIPDSHYIQNS
ncbi:DUF2459 domain-containing protein [Marinilabiliaceae bacterium ANBcel2]|nr:DUF2459 domain-containing protein [Marinilabiliaceae bacterium ANBcel2]